MHLCKRLSIGFGSVILLSAAFGIGSSAPAQPPHEILLGMNDVAQPGGPDELVRLDPNTGVGALLHTFSSGQNFLESLTYDPGEDALWTTNSGFLVRFDAHTFAEMPIGATGFDDIDGLAVQPGTGVLFGVTYGGNDLIKIDKTNASSTLVNGHLREGERLEDLAFDPAGRLFVLTSSKLVEVNPADGSVLTVVPLSGATSMEALVWWVEGGTFLSAADRPNFKDLVRIDRTTGQATFVSATLHSGFPDIEALTFIPGDQVPVEPSTWQHIKAMYRP